MIVFGSYYTRFKKHALHDVTCPNCGTQDAMNMVAGCRTYHLMFIPFAPGHKQITQRCTVCKGEFYPFPDKQEVARRMETETRRPWYLYIWLWFIALNIVLAGVGMLVAAIKG